jgi:hypothetical protein
MRPFVKSEAMSNRRRRTTPLISQGRARVAIVIATLACGGVTACGSASQIETVRTRTSAITRTSVATQQRAHVVRVKRVEAAVPQGIHMIAEFAACMRENGVDVPPPTPARPDPQLETRGVKVRSPRVRAASDKCGHYLRLNASSG